MMRSSSSGTRPGRTTSSRAASRGEIGRSAIRSGGSSKSNRSVRMPVAERLRPFIQGQARQVTARQSGVFKHAITEIQALQVKASKSKRTRRVHVLAVGPGRLRVAALIRQQNLRCTALLAQLLCGIDGKQERLPLTLVRTELLAVEADDPAVILACDQVARMRASGNKGGSV